MAELHRHTSRRRQREADASAKADASGPAVPGRCVRHWPDRPSPAARRRCHREPVGANVGANRVHLWRWRRSPLRRRSDAVEAWGVLVTTVLLLVGGPCTGALTEAAVRERLGEHRAHTARVQGVLVRDAPDRGSSSTAGGTAASVRGTVRWEAPDGRWHTGGTQVPPGLRAGARVDVWTDERGALVAEPPSPAEAAVGAALTGLLAAVVWGAVVVTGLAALRLHLDRERLAYWEREWARVGPRWSGGPV